MNGHRHIAATSHGGARTKLVIGFSPISPAHKAPSRSRLMTTTVSTPATAKAARKHLGLAILALAMGGFAIGTTEFAMMGLLKEIEEGLGISTPPKRATSSRLRLGRRYRRSPLRCVRGKASQKAPCVGAHAVPVLGKPDVLHRTGLRLHAAVPFCFRTSPHGAFFGVAAVIAAGLVAPTKRGWAISMVMAGLTVSNVIGVPLATWVGQTFGWRLLFVIVGAIGLLTVAMVWKFVPFEAAHPRGQHPTRTWSPQTAPSLAGAPDRYHWVWWLLRRLHLHCTHHDLCGWHTGEPDPPRRCGPLRNGHGGGKHLRRTPCRQIRDGHHLLGHAGNRRGLVVYAIAAHWAWAAFIMAFVVGGVGSMLTPALQTRLLDAAPGAASLASSLNHSASTSPTRSAPSWAAQLLPGGLGGICGSRIGWRGPCHSGPRSGPGQWSAGAKKAAVLLIHQKSAGWPENHTQQAWAPPRRSPCLLSTYRTY